MSRPQLWHSASGSHKNLQPCYSITYFTLARVGFRGVRIIRIDRTEQYRWHRPSACVSRKDHMFSQPAPVSAATRLKGAEPSQNLCNQDNCASKKRRSQKRFFFQTNLVPKTNTPDRSTNIRGNLCLFMTQYCHPPDYNDFGMLGGRLAWSRSH